MAEYATFSVHLDIGRNQLYNHALSDVSGRFVSATWSYGMQAPGQVVEFAPPATLELTLSNHDRAWFTDYQSVISKGMLVRIRATYASTTYTLCVCKFYQATTPADPKDPRLVTIQCDDAMIRFLNAEITPALQTNITTDAALQAIFDTGVITYPYDATYFVLDVSQLDTGKLLDSGTLTSFETGRTTIPYAGDVDEGQGVSAQSYAQDILAAEAGGRFYWDVKTETFTFHNRYHDTVNYSSAVTLVDNDIEQLAMMQTDVVANDLRVNYQPRSAGASAVTLFDSDSVPFQVGAGSTREMQLRFRDPALENARIASHDITSPVVGTDVIAFDNEDATGTNRSTSLSLSFTKSANSINLLISNTHTAPVYVTTLQIRGKKLTHYNEETAHAVNAQSIYDHDRQHSTPYMVALMGDAEFASDLAHQTVARFKDMSMLIPSITLRANQSAALMTQVLTRDIGDGLTLNLTHSNHNRSYIIIGMAHTLENNVVAGQAYVQHKATWILKPGSYESAFILDSTEYGVLDTDTLGF